MINKAIILGRLGKSPEIRTTQTGKSIASFSVATSESWKDKNTGEKREKTEWHNITVMNSGLVNIVDRYINKGDIVYIEGKINTNQYEKNGEKRYSTNIVLSGFDSKLTIISQKKDNNQSTQNHQTQPPIDEDLDDEIPF